LQWSSGVWAPRIDSWRVCEAGRWVNRTGVAPAARNCGELRVYLRGGSWRDSSAARGVVEDGGLEERPGGKAKPLGCLARVEVQWGGRSTVAQRTGHGGAEQGSGAGVLGGCRGGVVRTGGSRGGLKGAGRGLRRVGEERGSPYLSPVISGVGGADCANCSA